MSDLRQQGAAMQLSDEDVPAGIKPLYRTESPNKQVLVYEGETHVDHEGKALTGSCKVCLTWAPSLGFDLELSNPGAEWVGIGVSNGDDIQHKLQNGMDLCSFVRSSRINQDQLMELRFGLHACQYGNDKRCCEIIFHTTPFHSYVGRPVRYGNASCAARLRFEVKPWVITLDQMDSSNALRDKLRREGGFGLTHVGRLVRSDGKPFVVHKGRKVLDAFRWFLWFCSGTFVGMPIMVGLDKSGNRKYEEWTNSRATPFKHVASWFPKRDPEPTERLFRSFYERWTNKMWHDTLKNAVHWYVVANLNSAANEGSLVLVQIALERLAWSLLVQEKGALSEDGFTKLTAGDQLQLLVTTLGLPTATPKTLKSLVKYDEGKGMPRALVNIRNKTVHPVRQSSKPPDEYAVYEAMDASLWYLELALLKLLGYEGMYVDRLSGMECAPMERVPGVGVVIAE